LLREEAVLALEGEARPPGDSSPLRAPVPPYTAQILDRLLGGTAAPYETVEQLRQDLEAKSDRATEVTRLRRAGHLALTVVLLHMPFAVPFLLLLFSFGALLRPYDPTGPVGAFLLLHDVELHEFSPATFVCAFAGCFVSFWVVWAFLFRGGYAFWRGGIALRRADGRKASRWQCAYRTLLVWAPVTGLLCLANGVAGLYPGLPWLYFGIWGLGVALLLVCAGLALWSPTQGLHDRLAGVHLVPAHFNPIDLMLVYFGLCISLTFIGLFVMRMVLP
jgi:hypothetical protein